MLTQINDTTVRSDEGFAVCITDEHRVLYEENGRTLHFVISVQCCGGIMFVLHASPRAEHWDAAPGVDRQPISEQEYEKIVARVKRSLEYLQLDFAVA